MLSRDENLSCNHIYNQMDDLLLIIKTSNLSFDSKALLICKTYLYFLKFFMLLNLDISYENIEVMKSISLLMMFNRT